ncbi:MAG TPA: GyrI-like domain-containing protein [Planctomycetaceae bacterium]|jgi:predicted transcriptional regulator YdeE|nr:GyrI-like domain-containing protein [Planctomycetaceae bacterium]
MKVMVLVKATKGSEAGELPTQQLLTDMMNYNAELVKAGIVLAFDGLQPSSKGARVRFSGPNRSVTDGPFAETKELVAGYWLWQVKSLEDAIAWVKRCPNPMTVDSEIEIRPVYELSDFGDNATTQVREQNEQLRAESARYNLEPPRFETAKERLIAGPNVSYTFETRSGIPEQWHRFAPQIGKVPGQIGAATYGVSWNYKPGVGFDYICGVEVGNAAGLPKDFSQVRLPAGRYAIFAHRKHVSALPETLEAIWRKWLPNSGLQAADAPCFERYTEEFNPQTGMGGTEIWVALKA